MQTGYVKPEKKSKFSKILTSLSKYGMNYSDDIQSDDWKILSEII